MHDRRDVGMQTIWRMCPLLVRISSDNLRNSSLQLRLTICDQLPVSRRPSPGAQSLKGKMAAVLDVVAAAAESSENPSHPTGSGRDICVS